MLIVPLTFSRCPQVLAHPKWAALDQNLDGDAARVLPRGVIAAVWGLGFMYVVHPTPGRTSCWADQACLPPAPIFCRSLLRRVPLRIFRSLLSRKSMLPLLLFAVGVGLTGSLREPALPFVRVLQGGSAVFIRLFDAVMYVAPIGLLSFCGNRGGHWIAARECIPAGVLGLWRGFAALLWRWFSFYAYLAVVGNRCGVCGRRCLGRR